MLLSLYIAFVALYFISSVIHGVNIRNIFFVQIGACLRETC
jgi:hypothetical protein